MALLVGYGAGAVNPYLALEAIDCLEVDAPREERHEHYVHALKKGLLKVMSKMGISCCRATRARRSSRRSASARRSSSATSRAPRRASAASGSAEIARETLARHAAAASSRRATPTSDALDVGGVYAWRAAASGTSGARRPSPASRRRCASRTRASYDEYARAHQRPGRRALHAARAAGTSRRRRARCRSTRSSPRPRSSALRHRRDALRQHQQRGAREPGRSR